MIAARSIWRRLVEHFGGRAPTPRRSSPPIPTSCAWPPGCRAPRPHYLRSLAEHVVSGELELDRLDALDDEAVIAELTAVRGIGEWSAHMFLMFQLDRPDVLAVGDLGIRRAVERAYDAAGAADARRAHRAGRAVAPVAHASPAALLWRSLDNVPV